LLCKKIIVAEYKVVKTGWSNSSNKGHDSKRAVLPMNMIQAYFIKITKEWLYNMSPNLHNIT
jgi:isochorismate hydrolase